MKFRIRKSERFRIFVERLIFALEALLEEM